MKNNMARPKRGKWKKQRSISTIERSKKKSRLLTSGEVPNQVSAISPDTTTEAQNIERNNSGLTTSRRKQSTLARELIALKTKTSRRQIPYARSDSGNRIIHWESLKSLIFQMFNANRAVLK